ncbi:uncharacterized protein LOC115890287 [Sitophilus oryzae]|uniref:ascorbate ferrireductase (transmembrane) n=1 Tax=Sitophilus oryzae TaxID=7048 RepID=A0A6J2YSV8_SITOR|nr:uncharacterized protein LOC115890287 [Sitophilus oryzae]
METTASSSTLVINSSGSKSSSKNISYLKRTCWVLNYVYHQALTLISILFIWILIEDLKDNHIFYHMILSTVAYIPLMAVAIIAFSEDNLLTLYMSRTKIYWVHGILLSISALAVTIGISLEVRAKGNRPHFKSKHGLYGFISWVLVLVSVLIGLVAGNTRTFSRYLKPVIAKFIHNIIGIAAFIFGVVSLYYEIRVFGRYTSENVYNTVRYGMWVVTVWSVLAALKSLWGQFRNIVF